MTDKPTKRPALQIVKAGTPDGAQATEAQNLIEAFKAQVSQLVDCSDQVIVIGCVGGHVINIAALDPDRHKIMGALTDAYDIKAYGANDEE